MIQKSETAVIPISTINTDEESKWKGQLRNQVTCSETLLDLLEIDDSKIKRSAKQAEQLFPLKVTHNYISNIEKRNIHDPLLRQVLPLASEFTEDPIYSNDPTGDAQATKSTGLLHKYHGRVLIILTSACAIHCRYCFRREYPYTESSALRKEWQNIQHYLENDTSIEEVILSGGDPLMLDNEKLAELLDLLSNIQHIARIRIHSRLPIVLPDRVTIGLSKLFSRQRCQIILVVHCNHANEINEDVKAAIAKLKQQQICVLNQAVLLSGVNNNVDTLKNLSKNLFNIGVLPYYLHILDKVKGSKHFDLPNTEISQIYQALQASLPGYLVPKLVQDLPKMDNKILWV